jgi:hypothetical protein
LLKPSSTGPSIGASGREQRLLSERTGVDTDQSVKETFPAIAYTKVVL